MQHNKDYYNAPVQLPEVGYSILVDGYIYTVNEVIPHNDIHIIASISLRGEGGQKEIGYYEYLKYLNSNSIHPSNLEYSWTATVKLKNMQELSIWHTAWPMMQSEVVQVLSIGSDYPGYRITK